MKNKTYIFGIACVLLISAGAMFKIQHWPLAGIIITLGFALFVIAFMPIALRNSYQSETDKSLKKLYIIAYICIFIECTGTLFKIQRWPGTEFFLIVGIPIPFVLFLPAYVLHIRKNKQLNYNNLLLVLFFFAYFASITALLSVNVSRDMLDEMVMSANEYEEQCTLTDLQTNTLVNSLPLLSDSGKIANIQKINVKAISICDLADRMRIGIVKNIDLSNEQAIGSNGHINLWMIEGKDNKSIFYRQLFQEKASELKRNLLEYKELLSKTVPSNKQVLDYINHQLTISYYWEKEKFEGKYLVATIETLSSIKSTVKLVELETISAIAD